MIGWPRASRPGRRSAILARMRADLFGSALIVALAIAGCSGFKKGASDAGGVDTDGAAAGIPCSGLPLRKTGSPLGVASNGSLTSAAVRGHGRVAVAWEDVQNQRTWLALLDEQGAVQVKAKVVASSAISPALAVTPAGFALIVHDLSQQDLLLLALDDAGEAVGSPQPLGVELTTQGGYPALAVRGDAYAVLYTAGDEASGLELRFATLRSDGTTVGDWRSLADSTGNTAIGDLVATPGGFAAAWIDEREGLQRIFAARLDADGGKQAPGDVLVSAPGEVASFPDIGARGGDLEICYSINAGPGGEGDIACSLLAEDDEVPARHERLTEDPRVSSFQEVVWADGRYLVVWGDEQSGYGEIFGQLLTPEGSRQGPIMRLTQNDATSGYPGLVWLGDSALVFWFQYRAASGWTYEYQLYPCST